MLRMLALLASVALGVGAAHAQAPVVIDDTNVFPESLDAAADGTLYIGSLEKGAVYRAAPGAAKAEIFIRPDAPFRTMMTGVIVDEARNLLWVCVTDRIPPAGTTMLRSYDLKSGAAKGTYPFPGNGLCNDAIVDRNGVVYVTDTPGARILRLKPDGDFVTWVHDTRLASIDGIAWGPNGSIVVNTVQTNKLFRIDVKADGWAGAVTELQLSQALAGPDGLRPGLGGKLLTTENRTGKITEIVLDGDKAILTVLKEGFLQPTGVARAGNVAWIVEAKFSLRSNPAAANPFLVQPVPIK